MSPIDLKRYLRTRHPSLFHVGRFCWVSYLRMKRFFRRFVPYPLRRYQKNLGFHGDKILREFVRMLSLNLPISACIETGTYRGDTTFFLAEQFPNIPIYTIEINSEYAKESRWRLRNKKNVIVLQGSSPEELQRLFAQNAFGNFPLFFLDAHWYDYWPLLDELAVISKIQKAVIIIDDVRIPYRPTFAYDSYYDPRTGEKIDNDIEYIGHALRKDYTYKILMPDYDPKSVSLVKNAIIPGYIIIFQNIEGEDWQSIQNDHIFTNFRLITNNFK